MRARKRRYAVKALLCLAAFVRLSDCVALMPAEVAYPAIDMDAVGQLGVAGNFNGLSVYRYEGEDSILMPASTHDNIISQSLDQSYSYMEGSLVDGTISTQCVLGDNRTIVFAGDFEHARDVQAQGIASLDLTTGAVARLGNVSLGHTVNTLYCNGSQVWVGGSFRLGNNQGIGIWDNEEATWQLPLFGGFPIGSVINTIQPHGESILLGGKFGNLISSPATSNNANSQQMSAQEIGLASATVRTSDGTLVDSASVLCPSAGVGWSAQNEASGDLIIDIGRTIYPSKISLYNGVGSQAGTTKLFRLLSVPSNGIMNLTYTNTSTGNIEFCDAWCPLPQTTDGSPTEFQFVNVVPTTNLTIAMLDTATGNIGLQGIQLFTDMNIVTANNAIDAPLGCQNINGPAAVQLGGPWVPTDQYMSANVSSTADAEGTFVRYFPHFEGRANYTVDIYTPGCSKADSCSNRGAVNVTIYPARDAPPTSKVIYQTNTDIKYDTVYNGTIDTVEGFQPYVQIEALQNQVFPTGIVAADLKVTLISLLGPQIENLFEFSAVNFSKWHDDPTFEPIGLTSFNTLSHVHGPNITVVAIAASADNVILSTLNEKTSKSSIIKLDNGGKLLSQSNSSEEPVRFTSAANHVYAIAPQGVYNVSNNGADAHILGPQLLNVSASYITAFNLNGTEMVAFSTSSSTQPNEAIQLWNLESERWYNPKGNEPHVSGHLSGCYTVNTTMFYLGSLQILSSAASGAAVLGEGYQIEPLPFEIAANTSHITKAKSRRSESMVAEQMGTVFTAMFYNESLCFLGGSFTAETSDGRRAQGVLAVSKGASREVLGLENSQASISSMARNGSQLFLAGNFSNEGHPTVKVYEVLHQSLSQAQPDQLQFSMDPLLSVASADAPNASRVIAYGTFDGSSSVECPGFCLLTQDYKWSQPGTNLRTAKSSKVTAADFCTGDILVLAGSIKFDNGTTAMIATYDFAVDEFSPFPTDSLELEQVHHMAIQRQNSSTLHFVTTGTMHNGSESMRMWTGDGWKNLDYPFRPGSSIQSMKLLPATHNTSLFTNQILSVTGSLQMPTYGNISMATYDGETWLPLLVSSAGDISDLYLQHEIPLIATTSRHDRGGLAEERNFMPTSHVVGISFAIAVGCLSLLVLTGLAWTYLTFDQAYEPSR